MILMNLFSVFDPTSYFGVSLNWIVLLIVFVYVFNYYYVLVGGFNSVFELLRDMIKKMFNEVSFPFYMVLSYLLVSTFMYLVITNLLGLFPFVFTSSAHPVMTMGLGVVFWVSFFFMGWVSTFIKSAAHLVPEGSPIYLAPLMVMIESVSHLIRPFTLSIRLAANMMAGHLIIGLLAEASMINIYSGVVFMMIQSMLLMLEFGVAVIQGFVFSILLLLYALEYY